MKAVFLLLLGVALAFRAAPPHTVPGCIPLTTTTDPVPWTQLPPHPRVGSVLTTATWPRGIESQPCDPALTAARTLVRPAAGWCASGAPAVACGRVTERDAAAPDVPANCVLALTESGCLHLSLCGGVSLGSLAMDVAIHADVRGASRTWLSALVDTPNGSLVLRSGEARVWRGKLYDLVHNGTQDTRAWAETKHVVAALAVCAETSGVAEFANVIARVDAQDVSAWWTADGAPACVPVDANPPHCHHERADPRWPHVRLWPVAASPTWFSAAPHTAEARGMNSGKDIGIGAGVASGVAVLFLLLVAFAVFGLSVYKRKAKRS